MNNSIRRFHHIRISIRIVHQKSRRACINVHAGIAYHFHWLVAICTLIETLWYWKPHYPAGFQVSKVANHSCVNLYFVNSPQARAIQNYLQGFIFLLDFFQIQFANYFIATCIKGSPFQHVFISKDSSTSLVYSCSMNLRRLKLILQA